MKEDIFKNFWIISGAIFKRKNGIPLTPEEQLAFNRHLMFGEDDEAFPDEDEWSSIVD
jgi:hypothetical protein